MAEEEAIGIDESVVVQKHFGRIAEVYEEIMLSKSLGGKYQ